MQSPAPARQEDGLAEDDQENLKQQQARLHHVSEHLANERTILAWLRTAIAVMTLGIAINRFSLFLLEFSRVVPGGRTVNIHAEELGIGLVALGVLVMLGAIWHYLRVARMIEEGSYEPSRLKIVAAAVAVLVMGGTSLVWLLW
jgi:putative membrane protein